MYYDSLNLKDELYNIFRSDGINNIDANKSIFGIATIGLIIGVGRLRKLAQDLLLTQDRKRFENDIIISETRLKNVDDLKYDALNLISKQIGWKNLSHITLHIITAEDLFSIVQYMNIWDYNTVSKSDYSYPISSTSWVNKLVIEILKMHKGRTLFNADCGTGDFIMEMFNSGIIERAIGNTCNKDNYEITKIRRYFSNEDFKVTNEHFFSATILDDEKVDMVYCSYPLVMKYEKDEAFPMIASWDLHFNFNKKYSANLLWIVNALQSIKHDGIVVAFVANGILFNGIDEEIRRYLVANNYIDTIISLPNGILPHTNVSSSLVILKKNKGKKTSIRMIDATNIYSGQRRYKFFSQTDIDYIMDLYITNKHTEKSFDVTLNEIMENDAYLGMNRYCTYSIENAVTLGSVVEKIFRGYQLNAKALDNLILDEGKESIYRIINISDIQAEGFVNSDLKPIKADDKMKYDKFVVEDGDILITAKNTTIKSAIYRSNGDYKAVLSGNLIAIRVDPEKINPYYLKAFLDSEKGNMAIKSIQTGTSIITINANSLKNMNISLLSLDEQKAIGNEYKKNLDLIVDLIEKYKIAANYSSQIFDEVKKKIILKSNK